MKTINKIIKDKYNTYQGGEFMPVYQAGELLNKREFHTYKAKQAISAIKSLVSA